MTSHDPAVTVDRDFGPVAVALGWVPAPRFLLRRDVVLRRLRSLPRGTVLEVGCGAGTLLAELDALGFECCAVETSESALALSARFLAGHPRARVERAIPDDWSERFDYLLAFEVLEHIEDDTGALRSWVRCLRPGGRALLSVPAHARRWTATDTWAGHVRRYDRGDLIALGERAGLRVERCDNYGFPLANLIEPVNAWAHGRQMRGGATRDERSGESGTRRSAETRLYPMMASFPGRLAMRAAFATQRWFAGSSLGNGFILEGTRPA